MAGAPEKQSNFGDALRPLIGLLQIGFLAWMAYLLVIGGPYFYLLYVYDRIDYNDSKENVRKKTTLLKEIKLSEQEFTDLMPGIFKGDEHCDGTATSFYAYRAREPGYEILIGYDATDQVCLSVDAFE